MANDGQAALENRVQYADSSSWWENMYLIIPARREKKMLLQFLFYAMICITYRRLVIDRDMVRRC